MPKVIDFGIAKATEGRLTDATVYTPLNQFIGTLFNVVSNSTIRARRSPG